MGDLLDKKIGKKSRRYPKECPGNQDGLEGGLPQPLSLNEIEQITHYEGKKA